MTDLDKLIEAVEGGVFPRNLDDLNNTRIFKDWNQCYTAGMAFNGSLDAARALHDALLPGWVFVVSDGSASVLERGNGFATMEKHYDDNTARAWLIAVLKAYRAQVQA